MSLRIGRRKAITVALVLLVVGLAVAGWYLSGTDALLAVVLAAVVIGVGLMINAVVQVERRLRSDIRSGLRDNAVQVERRLRSDISAVSERTDSTRRELRERFRRQQQGMREIKGDITRIKTNLISTTRLEQTMTELDGKLQHPGEQAEALLRAVKAGYTRLELEQKASNRDNQTTIDRINRTMIRLFKHSPGEIDALIQVHRRMELDDPLPLMGGWALSPRGLLQAIDLVTQPEVSMVVECGSGTSTLFLARALQLKGSGRLIALEHLDEYLDRTEQAIKQHGLADIAEVRYAPLEEMDIDGTAYMWYSSSRIVDLADVDVLVVDGPPGTTGTQARYPAYPMFRERLAPSALILVDDAQRTDEKSIVDSWLGLGGLSQLTTLTGDQAVLQTHPTRLDHI